MHILFVVFIPHTHYTNIAINKQLLIWKGDKCLMKKSSFIAILMGTISGVLFALGMCMALIPEWSAFQPGIIFGCIGLVFGLITIIVWRRMEHKEPIKFSGKTIITIIVGIIGTLTLGVGMCFCMVWNNIILGVVIGLVGIVALLSLIPLVKGIKN